jgi:hypothetical protein
VISAERPDLSAADGFHGRSWDSKLFEIVFDRQSPLFSQNQVICGSPALVGMAFDDERCGAALGKK